MKLFIVITLTLYHIFLLNNAKAQQEQEATISIISEKSLDTIKSASSKNLLKQELSLGASRNSIKIFEKDISLLNTYASDADYPIVLNLRGNTTYSLPTALPKSSLVQKIENKNWLTTCKETGEADRSCRIDPPDDDPNCDIISTLYKKTCFGNIEAYQPIIPDKNDCDFQNRAYKNCLKGGSDCLVERFKVIESCKSIPMISDYTTISKKAVQNLVAVITTDKPVCSGVFKKVGSDSQLVTVDHCYEDINNCISSIDCTPKAFRLGGVDDGIIIKSYFGGSPGDDIAIFNLDQSITWNVTEVEVADSFSKNQPAIIAGGGNAIIAKDKSYLNMRELVKQSSMISNSISDCRVVCESDSALHHYCQTAEVTSGSPIILGMRNNKAVIVGLHKIGGYDNTSCDGEPTQRAVLPFILANIF